MAAVSVPVILPPSVEQLIATICREQNQLPLGLHVRRELVLEGEEGALSILRTIAASRITKSFEGFIMFLIKQRRAGNGSPTKRVCLSSPSSPSPVRTPTRLMMPQNCESASPSPIPMQLQSAGVSRPEISPQLEALGELEFRKSFLILSYLGGQKLEEVLSADMIRGLNNLSMEKFEAKVWEVVACKWGDIEDRHRTRYFSWDSGKTHTYHCHVYPDGSFRFKGPYLTMKNNFLQRTLGDDNVLLVKFAEGTDERSSTSGSINDHYSKYGWLVREGILVGLRRYRFFVFKDGGKEEKKKDPTTSPVKCYFVCMESQASFDSSNYILNGKTIREARSLFMNVDALSSMSKYMARFSLILSNTKGLDVDLSHLSVERIDDILCLDADGNVVKDKDGKLHIHTDGTGFISEDLALECQKNLFKGKCLNATNVENLLIQFRLFHNGSAVKGTFLVNKKLRPGTLEVRPSMIKVEPGSTSIGCTRNSLEIVGIGHRPRQACLSRTLIALLSYGGVPKEFFFNILNNSLEEAQGALLNKRAALRVATNHAEMDDFSAVNMIFSGIPLEEPYLQHNLRKWMSDERKSLGGGKLPVSESYYLMGTVDPTGLLKTDEVCIVLENGHLSGKVLVYRNPGLHFGDIHVLKARYVKELEDYIGNAKYAIFFPCKGPRSLADEIAGGDFDGDMYFVSRNPELLEKFKPSAPWTSASVTTVVPSKKPSEFSDEELEDELFRQFLTNRFNPSYTMSTAADSVLQIMDRLLTLGDGNNDETDAMKRNMNRLIDIYYDAIDAPKTGRKVELPKELVAELYPHFMEKKEDISYKSTSILGAIYDKVVSYREENQEKIEVWKLPCFIDKASESCCMKWIDLYSQYRQEMTAALNQSNNKDAKSGAAEEVINRYKEILYKAPNFEESKRNMADIFEEALAIYEVCYDYAKSQDAGRCSFAWKVAGPALCKYYLLNQGEQPLTCSPSVLKEIFG